MRWFILSAIFLLFLLRAEAQKSHKYPSLLWEISGKGLQKPSYLFGTMHVSNKIVFHLSDSFYLAIRNTDAVALETNPDSWQEDMYRFNANARFTQNSFASTTGFRNAPADYLTLSTLTIRPYEKLIEAALTSHPSTIDNLLYRSYSDSESDFEEDTYLDLYIYQIGKKWGKKVMGVERYEESMKLMMEAYADAMSDKNRKEKSYDREEDFSYGKLQDAYRAGNLDLLDTINRINSFSSSFDEKFLYRRNEIQAASIDSILRRKTSLFVGVGAAHLPGQRGVIEQLRRMGYKLRPIKMNERESFHKEEIEKVQVPVTFAQQVSADGFYKVDVPGKLYQYATAYDRFYQQQYADMANGSYYIVTRVPTHALLWGHTTEMVYKKVDSMLYENVPGKIISKRAIVKNGYKGIDLINKTRRGDYQRYQIFITPFELIIFKVSGTGNYVLQGKIADRFFNSIELKEYPVAWKRFSPAYGGFEVQLPHDPFVLKNDLWYYSAWDKNTGNSFEIIKTDVHNYEFVEEDTFDLHLMEESFIHSSFIEKTIQKNFSTCQGYPALEATYLQADGSFSVVKYVIQGPHYYTLIAHGQQVQPQMMQFLQSFIIQPFLYSPPQQQTDTMLKYTVVSPVFPAKKSVIGPSVEMEKFYFGGETAETTSTEKPMYIDQIITNDSTGEKIYVSFYRPSRYMYVNDSLNWEKQDRYLNKEASWIVRSKKAIQTNTGMRMWEYTLSDTNSSRMVWTKVFYASGAGFSIRTETDTLTPPSAFLSSFFQSFSPADTLKGANPFRKKNQQFFSDFFSADSALHAQAISGLPLVEFEPEDFTSLTKVFASLSWNDHHYLLSKKELMAKIGSLRTAQAAGFLQTLYYAAGDTLALQYAALESLLDQKNVYAYTTFKNIMIHEPPVLQITFNNDYDEFKLPESFMNRLYDSLQLSAVLYPDLLPLVQLEDYRVPVLQLLAALLDSNFVTAKVYKSYVPKLLLEAKQMWKKQVIAEKSKAIEQAQNNDSKKFYDDFKSIYEGNDELSLYARLLMPHKDENAAVQQWLQHLLTSSDKKLQYAIVLLFARYGENISDSLLHQLASLDEFRYSLYTDLNSWHSGRFFPAAYRPDTSLAKSKLMQTFDFGKPDTIAYLAQRPFVWKHQNGILYFFKYKRKKDDNYWKIATASAFCSDDGNREWTKYSIASPNKNEVDFTGSTNKRWQEDQPLNDQLQQIEKQLLYAKRKSAREFYKGNEDVDVSGKFSSFK